MECGGVLGAVVTCTAQSVQILQFSTFNISSPKIKHQGIVAYYDNPESGRRRRAFRVRSVRFSPSMNQSLRPEMKRKPDTPWNDVML